jgi:hypothetical protein
MTYFVIARFYFIAIMPAVNWAKKHYPVVLLAAGLIFLLAFKKLVR